MRGIVLLVAAALILLYAAWSLYRFRQDALIWADMSLAERPADVLYGVGAPDAMQGRDGRWRKRTGSVDPTATAWAYSTAAGGRVEVRFNPVDGRSDRVSCVQAEGVRGSCPSLYTIAMGDDELKLLRNLGTPDRSVLAGRTKIVSYDDIGAEYRLQRYVVYGLATKRERGGLFSRSDRFLHSITPW